MTESVSEKMILQNSLILSKPLSMEFRRNTLEVLELV
jgi:hypothetical protein